MKDYRIQLLEMLRQAELIAERMGDADRPRFEQDRDLCLILTLLLQRVGEAASVTTPQFRASIPEIPWSNIIGMRNRLVHDYQRIDDNIVWDTARLAIPELIAALTKALDRVGRPDDEPLPP